MSVMDPEWITADELDAAADDIDEIVSQHDPDDDDDFEEYIAWVEVSDTYRQLAEQLRYLESGKSAPDSGSN